MKIYIKKQNNEIITKFIDENGKEIDFDYVELINILISKDTPELSFDLDIDENDKSKIKEMYNKICTQVNSTENE